MKKKEKNTSSEKNLEGLGKLIGIAGIFVVIGLIVCLILGFVFPVKEIIAKKYLSAYKLLKGLGYFISFLPPLMITGYVVSCSVYFGKNSQGSLDRFSKAMFKRFKSVMISAVICTALITFGNEIFRIVINQSKSNIENRYKLVNEYIKVGNNLFDNGHYNRSMYYAQAALKLDPTSKDAAELKDQSYVEINRQDNANYRFKLYETVNDELKTLNKVEIDSNQIYDVYQCYLTAKEAFEKEEWFNAHYFAEMGIKMASSKDPNLKTLQTISTSAWNNLTRLHKVSKTQEQLVFERKYEGYLALVEKDDLKAYYIFHDLYLTSRDLQHDPDVIFYLNVAETRLKEKYFFIDETIELDSFENCNDVYFSLPYKDGSKDVVYFKGMKNVAQTGKSIQYVRNLTISSINKDGELFRSMTVPYAKILPVEIKSMNDTTKKLMGIDESIDFIPYIMLNSVGRDKPNSEIKPVYTYVDGEVENSPEYLLLPMNYEDLLLLEASTTTPEYVPFFTLFQLVNKAKNFGFSSEVYGQTLLNRMFFPLFVLIFFIVLAIIGWNNRIDSNQLFKMSWVLSFPFIFAIAWVVYKISVFGFQLFNYVMLGACNSFGLSIICSFVFYAIVLICFSIRFLSLRTRM